MDNYGHADYCIAIKALEKRLHSKASNIGLIGLLFTLCQSHRLKIIFVSKI